LAQQVGSNAGQSAISLRRPQRRLTALCDGSDRHLGRIFAIRCGGKLPCSIFAKQPFDPNWLKLTGNGGKEPIVLKLTLTLSPAIG
jgi:hypothetical protein